MIDAEFVAWLAVSYLIGAIPTSYLVGRVFRGIDLREHGSRNLGATNLYRTMGWKYAVPVGLFDVAKGAVPVAVFGPQVPDVALFPVFCGIAAVLGHVFSVFVGFKGGKGVATAAGVVLGLAPLALLVVSGVRGTARRRPGPHDDGRGPGRRELGHDAGQSPGCERGTGPDLGL
jgi:glycerol-3-phosphate acyltransferase PlsY